MTLVISSIVAAIAAFCVLPAVPAGADTGSALTLARVIELSAANAPASRLAKLRIEEEAVRIAGADVRAVENPRIALAGGPRTGDESGLDVELELEVPFEPGNRRQKRTAVARAGVQRETHAAGDARRQAVTAAAGAYLQVLQAEERLRFAGERKKVADDLLHIANERHKSGDAARFEVNLAKAEVAGAESEVASARGKAVAARAVLAQRVGLESGAVLQVAGDLKDRTFFDAVRSRVASPERDDLLAARADIEASSAAVNLAEAESLPDLAMSLSYKREGRENVALAGVSVELPFFNPRQAQVQEARVQHRRARLAAEITQAAIAAEIAGAVGAYDAAVEAVERIEREGLALQEENVQLAGESYRAGKINLSTLLQVRRDALETRREYLERLSEAADAGVALASATGAWGSIIR